MRNFSLINWLIVPTTLNNLKTTLNDSYVGKLKTVPVPNLIDVVDKEVIKNIKLEILKTRVNNLENKIPDASISIYINQCNTDKENLEQNRDVDQKYQIKVV